MFVLVKSLANCEAPESPIAPKTMGMHCWTGHSCLAVGGFGSEFSACSTGLVWPARCPRRWRWPSNPPASLPASRSAVPADFLYTRFADDAFAAGELPEETRARITKLRERNEPERLQARVLMLIYLLGLIQGDAEFLGVRATAETLADLLIENLEAGGDLRRAVPAAL